MYTHRTTTNETFNEEIYRTQTTIEFINDGELNDDNEISIYTENRISRSIVKVGNKYPKLWCILFVLLNCIILLLWIFCCSLVTDIMKDEYASFIIHYMIFHFILWCFKKFMKLISRKCDNFRMLIESDNINYLLINGQQYFSLEVYIEWIFTVLYFLFVRFFIFYHASTFLEYLCVAFLSLFSEIQESSIKYTEFWLNKNQEILNGLNFYYNKKFNHDVNWKYLDMFCGANCDINKWRYRVSLDMNIRFLADIVSGFYYIILFSLYTPSFISYSFKLNFKVWKAELFLTLSLLLEITRFVITYNVVLKSFKFNIIKPFVQYVESINTKHLIFLFLAYFSFFGSMCWICQWIGGP